VENERRNSPRSLQPLNVCGSQKKEEKDGGTEGNDEIGGDGLFHAAK